MKIIPAVIALPLAAIAAGGVISKTQQQFLDSRVRVVARDCASVSGHIVYTYRQGAREWKTTNAVQRVVGQAAGGDRYSKYRIIVNAKASGKWAEMRAAIVSLDLMDEWNACQFISSEDPNFISATNKVVQSGLASTEDIKEFLDASKDD